MVLLDLASDEQQDRYLAGVAKGAVLTAALNEPGAPLPDRPATTFADGRLNGTKVAVPYAEQAEWIVVTADSAVVVVSPKADGVQVTKTPSSNRADEYTVTFSDAEADGVLEGAQAHRVNQLALAAIGAFASGLVAGALRLTADYVANRHQFGKPLSTFQTVAAQLAEVYIASRTLTLAATHALEALLPVLLVTDGGIDHLDDDGDADILPHLGDRRGHGLVVGDVADRGLDDDRLAAVAGPSEPLPSLSWAVRERWQGGVMVIVPSGGWARSARRRALARSP